MANAGGFIYESIWRDPDFQALSEGAQRLYMQLLTQKELDCAGILPLHVEKWANGCLTLTVTQVWAYLDELQDGRFVFYDRDTYEALVRSYIRRSNVLKVPNMVKSACRSSRLVASSALRAVLAAELRATGREDCASAADEIDPIPVTLPEPFKNPSRTLPEPTGEGKGKGVTHLGNNSGGEESRPTCSTHKDGNPNDEPCRGCRKVREWDEKQAAAAEADELLERRRQREIRDACQLCDENGLVETRLGMRRCDHQEAAAHA